LIKEELDR